MINLWNVSICIAVISSIISVVDCSHIITKSTEGERGFQMITLFVTIAMCKSDYGEGRGIKNCPKSDIT